MDRQGRDNDTDKNRHLVMIARDKLRTNQKEKGDGKRRYQYTPLNRRRTNSTPRMTGRLFFCNFHKKITDKNDKTKESKRNP